MARSFSIESNVRGHHVFKSVWTPTEGELLTVNPEPGNEFDRYALAVCKGETVVGHMPREISQICWYFLRKKQSSISCKVTGHRRYRRGKGLEVPCVYVFAGKQAHLEQLMTLVETS